MTRTCLFCDAYFSGKDSLDKLLLHKKKCSKEQPYKDDPNADGYED